MALPQDELQRLSRAFLTGGASPADIDSLKIALETDPQAGLQLLGQMEKSLDGVAPAGFTPDQWAEVDSRVKAMIQPLAKGGGIFSKLFGWLFRRKPAAPPKPKEEPLPEPPAPAAPVVEEEMAPIAAEPAKPAESAPAGEAPAEEAKPRPKKSLKGLWIALAVLAVLAGVYSLFHFGLLDSLLKRAEPAPVEALPTPVPTPTPRTGPPERSLPITTPGGPLPSELPELTPRAAGERQPQPGLEAHDKEGRRGFPLP